MSTRRWYQSLAARYGVVMVGFVVLGSLLLLAWLSAQQQEESRRLFVTVAKNDVDFVKRLNLPRSAKLARDLRRLLRVDIHFRPESGPVEPALLPEEEPALMAALPSDQVLLLPSNRQALVLDLDAEHDMLFVRDTPATMLSLWRPTTLYALIAFWAFSALFAWVISRQVVLPVRRLMRHLKTFFDDSQSSLQETRRPDEIGDLARALTQARDDLMEERIKREQSERMALLGRVATGLAHEIKNPLASIQLHAQLMESDAMDAESRTSLGHLLAEVQVIEGLVNQWLYLARPASPKTQPLLLLPVLQETVQTLAPQAAHADVTVQIDPGSASAATVLGDRMRLQQVFRNIIVNAIQAMPGQGRLTISLHTNGKEVRLAFHDQGRGFSPKALQQGTQLFFSEKEGGMGVGLNVAGEIVSAHNGSIVLKNCPSGGAVVEITLPMSNS